MERDLATSQRATWPPLVRTCSEDVYFLNTGDLVLEACDLLAAVDSWLLLLVVERLAVIGSGPPIFVSCHWFSLLFESLSLPFVDQT